MPPKDLQEFLREIRGEAAQAEPPRKPQRPVLEPDERQAEIQADRAKRDRDAFRDRDPRRDRGRAARQEVPDRRPRAPAKEEPAREDKRPESVHEYLDKLKKETLAEEAREATVPPEDLAGSDAPIALSVADEEFAARFGRLDEAEPAPRAHPPRGLQEIQQGLTLREAIVAQTILGPPRSRDPIRARPRGAARPPQEGGR
jgi:hypothetical protein